MAGPGSARRDLRRGRVAVRLCPAAARTRLRHLHRGRRGIPVVAARVRGRIEAIVAGIVISLGIYAVFHLILGLSLARGPLGILRGRRWKRSPIWPTVFRSPHLQNLGLALLGCFLGTIIGALPGLGPANGVAILIPLAFTLGLPATPALILLTSVYYGAMYGGRISSILLNIPGDEPAMMTTLDGYPDGAEGSGRRGAGDLRRSPRSSARSSPPGAWCSWRRNWSRSRCCSDRRNISRCSRSPSPRSAAWPAATRPRRRSPPVSVSASR